MVERFMVVQTQSRRERWAAENIFHLGYNCYSPKVYVVSMHGRMRVAKVEPLFPRHLFVQYEGRWRSLLGTWGVTGIIMQGQEPGFILDKELKRLRAAEDSDGIINLPEYKQAPKFAEGQEIRVASGHLSGYKGIYQGFASKDRVKVLLDHMGRKSQVLIAEEFLEVA